MFNFSDKHAVVDEWRRLFAEDLLAGIHFRDHWRFWVPRAFIPPNSNGKGFEWEVKNDVVRYELLAALEDFICGSDAEDFFKRLPTLDGGRSVCGKVLKMGEPSYNCRECSTDLTCVLCVSCFQQSAHRFHKYKMGTSMGGGCCDCGDVEAWKSDPHCDTHLAGKAAESEGRQLPEDLLRRAAAVFSAVLQYCSEVLDLDRNPDLPPILISGPGEAIDNTELYCTILYDHESHTFEEVVNMISSVVNCPHKTALDYVNNLDKEGRTIINCSSFLHCNRLKQDIEKLSSRPGRPPLEAGVIHSHLVAHQMFALRLLDWLLERTSLSKNFRTTFNWTALSPEFSGSSGFNKPTQKSSGDKLRLSNVERILLQDPFLWKKARLYWHRLFIESIFMEYENKKAFANVFAKQYPTLLKNFIHEEYDYCYSFASLSIQIFTVPTLALNLISHEDILYNLLNTFVAECSRKRNDEGKLEFNRLASVSSFRRAILILHDLRYLLHSPPDIWTSELRRGFVKGIKVILNLFSYMQGMNLTKRQIKKHIDYEPEWETAFNLQTKLSPIIALILKWCEKDQIVFSKVYMLTLRKMFENFCNRDNIFKESKEVANHNAICYKYDVSTEPVSIHLPLSRFLAGLFLLLGQFGFTFYSSEFISLKKPTPQELIEPVLRVQVMIAQVQASLWRKNGYSLSNQIYYYHSVKCRREMQDKDIVMLQFVATLIDPNEFLIHVLNKFKLIDWTYTFETDSDNKWSNEYMKALSVIVEEFLSLLISIVSERFVPGVGQVTEDDCIRNEIAHQLFVRPLSHSKLSKTLPFDITDNGTGLETAIDHVAQFKRSTQSTGKGVYVVKPEFMDKYNVFFYHYSKEDMSMSEEAQRKRRKATCGFECCPPPVLPRFTATFKALLGLLHCDVMLHIMKIVLERALSNSKISSEGHLYAVLHLIGYALQAQEEESSSCANFTTKAEEWGLKILLEDLCKSQHIEVHKDLIRWAISRFNSVAAPVTSNVKNQFSSIIDQNMTDHDQEEVKNMRAKLAAGKRAAILEQMAILQQNFLKQNATLFQTNLCRLPENSQPMKTHDSEMSAHELKKSDVTIALDSKQTYDINSGRALTCILCQEDQVVNREGPPLITTAFLQRSAVLVRKRTQQGSDNQLLGSNIGPATHLSTCGHVMHFTCWNKYVFATGSKKIRRDYRFVKLQTAFDAEKNEYLCPLCQRLSNTVLPIIPHLSLFCDQQVNMPDISFSDWYELALCLKDQNDKMYFDFPDIGTIPVSDLCQQNKITSIFVKNAYIARDVSSFERKFLVSEDCLQVINMVTDACCIQENEHKSISAKDKYFSIWKTCAYTLHSSERFLRYMDKSLLGDFTLSEQESLQNLIRLTRILPIVNREKRSTKEACTQMLNMLFGNEESVLDWDSLGILIPLMVCMSNICCDEESQGPLENTIESHCFRVALLIHFVQTIVCTDLNESLSLSGSDVTSEDTECLSEVVRIFKDSKGINTRDIWDVLKKSSISFLRCCAIYFYFLRGVAAPKALHKTGDDTFENIMDFLGMPTSCKDLLGSQCILSILRKWARHPKLVELRQQVICRDMSPLNGLVELPEDYSEIINSAIGFRCANSDKEDVRNANLCLICGEMLCSETYCCRRELASWLVGACTFHAHSCGAGVGLFLRVRDCEVLLIGGADRGCLMPAPYLDDYGEPDQGLARGARMLLCRQRYRELQVLWMSHGVPDHIARSIEHNNFITQAHWNHL